MTTSEARQINAHRWCKRMMVDIDDSISKTKRIYRTFEMLSIKEIMEKFVFSEKNL